MQVDFHLRGRCFHQSSRHVSGFDGTLSQMFFVNGVNLVDERQIRRAGRIEVMTKTAIDEDVDDVRKANEQLEMKLLDQQRQNVLGPDAFEPFL